MPALASTVIIDDSDEEDVIDLLCFGESTNLPSPAHAAVHEASTETPALPNMTRVDVTAEIAPPALLENTPQWKMQDPSMSTSPLTTQAGILPARSQHAHSQPQADSTVQEASRLAAVESMADELSTTEANPSKQSFQERKAAAQPTDKEPAAPARDEWEFVGSVSDESDQGRRKRKKVGGGMTTSRSSTKAIMDAGPKKRSFRQSESRLAVDAVDFEEEEDDWNPGHASKSLDEEPSHPRRTRQHGSVGLMQGLEKKKRRRAGTDMGSATETSLVSRKTSQHSQKPCVDKAWTTETSFTSETPIDDQRNEPPFLVDLAKPAMVLTESQKQEYEQVSAAASSGERVPVPSVADEHSSIDQLLSTVDITIRAGTPRAANEAATNSYADEPGVNGPTRPSSVGSGYYPRSIMSDARTSSSSVGAMGMPDQKGPKATSRITSAVGAAVSSEDDRHFHQDGKQRRSRPRSNPPLVLAKSATVDTEAKRTKKRRSNNATGHQVLAEEDESFASGAGLPVEQYNPRPTRSRRRIEPEEVQQLCLQSKSGSIKQLRESRKAALRAKQGEAAVHDERTESTTCSDRPSQNPIGNADTQHALAKSETRDGRKKKTKTESLRKVGKKRGAESADAAGHAEPLCSSSKSPKVETSHGADEIITVHDEPALEHLNNRVLADPSTSKERLQTPAPLSPAPEPLDVPESTEHSTITPAPTTTTTTTTTTPPTTGPPATPATQPPAESPASKPRVTPHSPLKDGKVPYRVGLSKRVKIAPLLRVVKR